MNQFSKCNLDLQKGMCFMRFFKKRMVLVALVALTSTAFAQQGELVTEIVARINNDIITLADYQKAVNDFVAQITEELKQQKKTDAEIQAEIEKQRPKVLDYIIDDMLFEQKAKELGADVEAQVNEQMLEVAKRNGFKNILEFEAALKQQGIDPEVWRNQARKQLLQQYVFNREIVRPIYENLTEKDKLAWWEKHKKNLEMPAQATLSEIFLSLENQTAAEVEQRAKRIVAELRAGKNFVEAVQQYSAPNSPSRALNGKLGTFVLDPKEIREDLLAAVKDLKTGDVTEPIRQQNGYQIIRVDEKKEPTVPPFNDPKVQQIVNQYATMERAEEARKKYLKKLREEAFIDIKPAYDPAKAKPADSKGD